MGWLDEQINARKKNDDEVVGEAFAHIAGAISGQEIAVAYSADRLAQTAIEEILRFYMVKPREIPTSVKALEDQLEYLLRPSGIMRRNVELVGTWYRDGVGALLGVLKEEGTVIALIPEKFGGYSYADRTTGKRIKVTGKNADRIAVEAIAFYKPLPLRPMTVKDLYRYMWESVSGGDVALCITSVFAATVINLLIPVLTKVLTGTVVESDSYRGLFAVGIFMLCSICSVALFQTVKAVCLTRIRMKMDQNLEAAIMMRLLSLPADFFKKYSAGELGTITDELSILCSKICDVAITTGLSAVFGLLYVCQVFVYVPSLGLPALGVLCLVLLVFFLTYRAKVEQIRKELSLASKESGLSYALLCGVQKVRLSGAEKRVFAKWGKKYAEVAAVRYNPALFVKITPALQVALTMLSAVLMYVFSMRKQVDIPSYYAFAAAYGMALEAFLHLLDIVNDASGIRPLIELAEPLLSQAPEVSEQKQVLTRLTGAIELSNVSFRYSENTPFILDDVSLKIRPGQYVAIVGKTGCGKSTLMRLLLGFETPQKGAVYFDGKDLKTIDLRSLRKKVGTVIQNGSLFQGDIYSNITISAPELSLEEAWEAAEHAGVAEDIRQMPMGMFTLIGDGGSGISGGQKQRLMIARAIAPKPKLLLLDEATSALDNLTQKTVSDALAGLNCTRIVIAHRLSTIRQCDRILVLDGGHIVEDGTYEELIAAKGFFAELVEKQQLTPTSPSKS